jgi:phosphoglycerate kinase
MLIAWIEERGGTRWTLLGLWATGLFVFFNPLAAKQEQKTIKPNAPNQTFIINPLFCQKIQLFPLETDLLRVKCDCRKQAVFIICRFFCKVERFFKFLNEYFSKSCFLAQFARRHSNFGVTNRMTFLEITHLDLRGKTLLIREDFNVPLKNGKITSDARLIAALPTIRYAVKQGAAIILVSHLGRPTPDDRDNERFSLQPIADRLSTLLDRPIPLIKDWLDGVNIQPGQIVLCENIRFQPGESSNDDLLAKKMASLCDIYVNDAFATAHRKTASTYGIVTHAKIACAGLLFAQEVAALNRILKNPKRPLIAVVGGAKLSTKLKLLQSIAKTVDYLIVGGGIANTFLAAAGYDVGKSLVEPSFIQHAKEILASQTELHVKIPLPEDVIVAEKIDESATATEKKISDVMKNDIILDIGPRTRNHYAALIEQAQTVLWNGPLGVFEFQRFSGGTEQIARAIAKNATYSVAGGGETIEAIEKYQLSDNISYISTAGGAFLTYLEGNSLPTIAALEQSYDTRGGN